MPTNKKKRRFGRVTSRRTPRLLHLKIRVLPLVAMPKSAMFRKIQQLASSGIVPEDVQVAYMDYDHSVGNMFQSGDRVQGDDLEAFQEFAAVMGAIAPKDVFVGGRRGKYTKNPVQLRLEKPDV